MSVAVLCNLTLQIMDESDITVDPQAEVRKLQDLVKKLERQNEVLRGKQKLQLEALQNGEIEKKLGTNHNNNISEGLNHCRLKDETSEITLDDVNVLDVDQLSVRDEEDSWLYSSPKPPTPSQSRVSPYEWVRQELDHPSPEVESVKRSLIHRLDEAARISRSSSTPAFASITPLSSRSNTRMSQSAENTPVNSQRPVVRKSLGMSLGNRVDTGTFTRPKKSREIPVPPPPTERFEDTVDHHQSPSVQHDSLRQSLSQAQSSPRRAIRSKQIPQPMSVFDNECDSSVYNRASPVRYDENSSKRSLPNVSRLAHSSGMYSSDPYLDNNSSGGSDDYERPIDPRQYNRMQTQMRPASPNVSGLRQPQNVRRGLSPQRTGLPQPARRSIPRPGTVAKSGIATPRRYNLQFLRQDRQVTRILMRVGKKDAFNVELPLHSSYVTLRSKSCNWWINIIACYFASE
ncbi:hypothetical protein KUTeg_023937 [Tegillarca granosa]|uniref:SLAIN motif-containing protein 2 n=1 Tax=Tegillarca granosa TaxID=220873 RepID=A0ABQ9DYY5_TEGGR|nr:hypothetical protein KUTeg_023937 [Tegillarca granosa]